MSVSRETYLAKLYLDRAPRAAPPAVRNARSSRRRRWAWLLAWLRPRV